MDKLFEYLIVIVVVLGPVLAAVVKKLIAFFSPEKPETTELPGLPKSRVRPVEVVPKTERPVARSVPQAPAHRPVARPVVPPAPSAGSVARPAMPSSRVPIALEALVEDHLGHLTSKVEGEQKRIGQGVESRLGHLESSVRPTTAPRERSTPQRKGTVGSLESTSLWPLSRKGLRQAILLREILGPPIALRAPDDQW